mmetsp:Transcript_5285/g.15038  ORF Transcript_5285/g.15038 Transcript_5285/m.15038 type:complete len:267 (-) Transcript_5285:867-1667(-)
MPTDSQSWAALVFVSSVVFSPPHTSTNGRRYTGLKGWTTTRRSGCFMPDWSRVGRMPDVEEVTTQVWERYFSARAYADCFISSLSGRLSTRKSACCIASTASALSNLLRTFSLPRFGVRPGSSFSTARSALLMTAVTRSSIVSLTSSTVTSRPFSRKRAAHPLPITPPPRQTTFVEHSWSVLRRGTTTPSMVVVTCVWTSCCSHRSSASTRPNLSICSGSGSHGCFTSFSFRRTSSGPRTLQPMASRMPFAFATSCSLLASSPRER